ncbi:hypothetical protein C8R45DRAFT_1181640 [Mycena sanguinolenta]|nr:hypothetical protein C8R45DRAFT_1181640 [Mycena sanguinolenta]
MPNSFSRGVSRGKPQAPVTDIQCHKYIRPTLLPALRLWLFAINMLAPTTEAQTIQVQVNINGGVGGNGGEGGSQGGGGGAGEAPRIIYHVHAQYFSMENHLCAVVPGMNLEAPGLLGNFAENSDRFPPSPATKRTHPLPNLDENPSNIVATERFLPSSCTSDFGQEQSRTPSRYGHEIEQAQTNFSAAPLSPSEQHPRRMKTGKSDSSLSTLDKARPVYAQSSEGSSRLSPTLSRRDMWEHSLDDYFKMFLDVKREKPTSDWNPDGLHCYVTGGSTGLGLELAKLLAKKGAHVSIVARNQERLDNALAQIEEERKFPGQQLHAYSFSLYTAANSAAALAAVCAPHNGNAPDAIFTCAGAARPMYFVEMSEEDFRHGMDDAYWVQAWTIFAAVKLMVKQKRKGRLALVSSTLGYMPFVGWGSYAPGKQALRGLADPLQSELMLYPDLTVHIYFPPSILTPGEVFPPLTTRICLTLASIIDPENAITPDVAARSFLRGVQKGQAHVTSDFIADMFRASTRGATPKQNWIKDAVLDMLAYFVAPIWRSDVDRRVRASREEHMAHLQKRGFFD